MSVVRGNAGYGRKPKRGVLREMARGGEMVDVHYFDPNDGTATIETTQYIEPILKANQADYNSDSTPNKDFRLVASIPMVEIMRLHQQGINVFQTEGAKKLTQMLDSGEYQLWRTRSGHIGKKPHREYPTLKGR
jgi:hypothetical protein